MYIIIIFFPFLFLWIDWFILFFLLLLIDGSICSFLFFSEHCAWTSTLFYHEREVLVQIQWSIILCCCTCTSSLFSFSHLTNLFFFLFLLPCWRETLYLFNYSLLSWRRSTCTSTMEHHPLCILYNIIVLFFKFVYWLTDWFSSSFSFILFSCERDIVLV